MLIIKIWFDEAFKNLYKSPLVSFLTVSFFIVLFLFLSILSNVFTPHQELTLKNNEAYLNYSQYYISFAPKFETDKTGFYRIPSGATEEDKYKLADEFETLIEELSALQSDDFIMIKTMSRSFHFFDFPYELSTVTIYDISTSVWTVTENFFKYETLPIMQGRNLTEEDFDFQYISTNENPLLVIPVLAGSQFREYYNVGDQIMAMTDLTRTGLYKTIDFDNNYPDHFLDQEWCAVYEIKGFLEEGTTFSNSNGAIMLADRSIIALLKPVTRANFPDIGINLLTGRIGEISEYKFYITKDKVDEHVRKMITFLNKTSLANYFEVKPAYTPSVAAIFDEIEQARKNTFIVIAVALSFFSIVGISIATINKFKGNLKDYGTHILLGATSFDISMMGVIEMSIQLLIADILIHLPFLLAPLDIPLINFINRNIPYFQSTQMYVMLGIANLVFIAVTVLCNLYCIKKYPLIEIIRRKE